MADLDAFVVAEEFFTFTVETFKIDIFEVLLVDLVDLDIGITLVEITAKLEEAGFVICTGYGASVVDGKCECSLENTILDEALGRSKINRIEVTE